MNTRSLSRARKRRINEGAEVQALLDELRLAFDTHKRGKIEDAWDNLFSETVPPSGNADTVGGEIMRATGRIKYRYFNDGDCIGVGYGNETCNAAARYLCEIVRDKKVETQIGRRMWGREYRESDVFILLGMIAEYLWDHPELFTERNHDDMWDWEEPEDRHYDDEDDDEDGEW